MSPGLGLPSDPADQPPGEIIHAEVTVFDDGASCVTVRGKDDVISTDRAMAVSVSLLSRKYQDVYGGMPLYCDGENLPKFIGAVVGWTTPHGPMPLAIRISVDHAQPWMTVGDERRLTDAQVTAFGGPVGVYVFSPGVLPNQVPDRTGVFEVDR